MQVEHAVLSCTVSPTYDRALSDLVASMQRQRAERRGMDANINLSSRSRARGARCAVRREELERPGTLAIRGGEEGGKELKENRRKNQERK